MHTIDTSFFPVLPAPRSKSTSASHPSVNVEKIAVNEIACVIKSKDSAKIRVAAQWMDNSREKEWLWFPRMQRFRETELSLMANTDADCVVMRLSPVRLYRMVQRGRQNSHNGQ